MRVVIGWSWAVLLGVATPAAAQGAGPAPPPVRRLQAMLRINGMFFDNFFQAREGAPEEGVAAVGVEAHLSARVRRDRPLEGFAEADYIAYRGFGPSRGITVGLRAEGRRHSFEVALQYLAGRPSREIGDVLERADVGGAGAEYSHRLTDDVELIALTDFRRQTFEISPANQNDVFGLGGALRYRGFGRRFSPEAGLRWSRRNARADNEDLSQREAYLRLRWAPTRAVYLSLRYRRRDRDYTVQDSQARNFAREDHRGQWTLSADLRQSSRLSWNLYYAREDSDSTRPSGVFHTQMVAAGATLRF